MEAQDVQGTSHNLKRVRCVGINATYTGNTGSYILDRLAQLADGTYEGLNAEGLAGDDPFPVLDGKLTVHADVYEDSLNTIREKFPKLELIVQGEYYIRFKDAEFQRLVISQWGGGKSGVRRSDLIGVTNVPFRFAYGNTLIKDLSDFGEYFPNVTMITKESFADCINLSKFGIPDNPAGVTLDHACFLSTALDEKGISLNNINSYVYSCFGNTKFVNMFIPRPKSGAKPENAIASININNDSKLLKYFEMDEGFTTAILLSGCSQLEKVILPSTITSIPATFLHGSSKDKILICKAVVPPTHEGWGYQPNPKAIYVPDASVDAYKSATNWITYADKIRPLSQYKD